MRDLIIILIFSVMLIVRIFAELNIDLAIENMFERRNLSGLRNYNGARDNRSYVNKSYNHKGNYDQNIDNFVYDEYLDESGNFIEEGVAVLDADQEYLNRDLRPLLMKRFPVFNSCVDGNGGLNADLEQALLGGEGIYWSNKALSYMRNRWSFVALIDKVLRPNKIDIRYIVDATAGIGGDSISFGLMSEVQRVIAYELDSEPYEMLCNNIKLYHLSDKIVSRNMRFDYDFMSTDCGVNAITPLVIVDPPYEKGNNATNYNLSIDAMPIYAVCDKILAAGAAAVVISMPGDYRYNMRYAAIANQSVLAYRVSKNVKLFLVRRLSRSDK